jgi:sugar lactone lactonase YvrE
MVTETNQVSVLVAESNESHGVTQDSRGRLISAQAWDGSTRIGVIYPPGSEAVLADSFDGKPFSRPNDLIVARNGGIYFTDPGLTMGQAEELVERYGGEPLAPRLPPAVYYLCGWDGRRQRRSALRGHRSWYRGLEFTGGAPRHDTGGVSAEKLPERRVRRSFETDTVYRWSRLSLQR